MPSTSIRTSKTATAQGMSTLTIGGVPQVGAVPWELPPNPDAQACASGPREILSWEVGQKYFFDPTFGNALVAGQRNVFTTTADFTGIAFLDSERRFAPHHFPPAHRNQSAHQHRVGLGLRPQGRPHQFQHGAGELPLRPVYHGRRRCFSARDRHCETGTTTATERYSTSFGVLFGYGQLNKRGLSAATSFGFDANHGSLQYATAQTSYNWDCCGLSLEYRRFALGAVRNENQYRFYVYAGEHWSVRQPQAAGAAVLAYSSSQFPVLSSQKHPAPVAEN